FEEFHDAVMKQNSMPIEMVRATLTNQKLTRDYEPTWKFYDFNEQIKPKLFYMSTTTSGFKSSLGLMDATMLVAGSMIGSGIFIVSADIARNTGSAGWLMVVWLITGFM